MVSAKGVGPGGGQEGGLEVRTHGGHSEGLVPAPPLTTLTCGAGNLGPGRVFCWTEAEDSWEALNATLRCVDFRCRQDILKAFQQTNTAFLCAVYKGAD